MKLTSALVIRKGSPADIPFLVDAIVAAEKSGTEKFSYSSIFELEESKVREILAAILAEDAPGQELCYSEYLVAESGGIAVGAVAGWLEGESGQRGSIIKGTLLNYFFPKENMEKALEKRHALDMLHFEPSKNALVIDICYTVPEWRGNGIVTSLIRKHFQNHLALNPHITVSQIDVLKTNEAALHAYIKLGYQVKEEKKSTFPDLLEWLPSDTLLVLEKNLLESDKR